MNVIYLVPRYFIWFSLLVGVILFIINFRFYKENFYKILPYSIFGVLLILIMSTYVTLRGGVLSNNIEVMSRNLFTILSHSFIALTGLYLFDKLNIKNIISLVDENFDIQGTIQIKTISILTGLNILFSFFVFQFFNFPLSNIEYPYEIILGILGAISEELLVRVGFIGMFLFLFRKISFRWFLAISLSSLIWTLIHFQGVDHDYVRLIQIFPYGLTLGYLLKKYGFEACLISHIGFNVIIMTISRI